VSDFSRIEKLGWRRRVVEGSKVLSVVSLMMKVMSVVSLKMPRHVAVTTLRFLSLDPSISWHRVVGPA